MAPRQQSADYYPASGRTRPKIAGVTMVDWALPILRAGIMQGRYAPGQRLVEADLMMELSISRGPIREVLRRLASEGLVAIEPYRGAVVSRLTRDSVENTFQIREALEGLAARLCAERVRCNLLQPTEVASKLQRLAELNAERPAEYMEHNDRFHASIVEFSGNSQIARTLSQLRTPAVRNYFPSLLTRELVERSAAEHEELVIAICAGNAALAAKLAHRHVQRAAKMARNLPDFLFPISR